MMLRVLIADDEEPARSRLRKLLQPLAETGHVQVVGEASDGIEVLQAVADQVIDLLLLDVQMPGLNGFEVLERIAPNRRPHVVFTTAYDSYALKAFEANAVDYLLKPVPAERLRESIERVERIRGTVDTRQDADARMTRLLDWIDAQSEAAPRSPAQGRFLKQISIGLRDRILVVPVSRLVCAEVIEGITRLFLLDEQQGPRPHLQTHVTSYTLDQLEENLDPAHFLRVHRSAIVQVEQIQEMIPWFSGRYKLLLTGGHEVIASRERSRVLRERLLL